MKRLSIFLFLIVFSFSYAGILSKIENKMKKIGTIEADFTQIIDYKEFDEPDVYGGKIILNKKGQILVKYTKNYKLIIYVNGDTIKYYNPEDEQVYTKKIKKEFFFELFQTFVKNGDIMKFFQKVNETKLKNGDYQITLIPKKEYKNEGLNKVIFIFDKNLKIKRLTLFTDDNNMDYKFSNVKYYKEIKDIKFTTKL